MRKRSLFVNPSKIRKSLSENFQIYEKPHRVYERNIMKGYTNIWYAQNKGNK